MAKTSTETSTTLPCSLLSICLLKRNSAFGTWGTDGPDAGVPGGGAAMDSEGRGPEREGIEELCVATTSARKVPVTGGQCSETRGRGVTRTRSREAFVGWDNHADIVFPASSCPAGVAIIPRLCSTPLHPLSDAVAVFGSVGRVSIGELISIASSVGLRIGPSSSSIMIGALDEPGSRAGAGAQSVIRNLRELAPEEPFLVTPCPKS